MKFIIFQCICLILSGMQSSAHDAGIKKPTVLISILVRNKAHTLPFFLTFLEQLNYPKSRLHLWIQSDNNVDNSIEILNTWLKDNSADYHDVNINFDEKSKGFDDETGIADWSVKRFHHVINLREEALNYGRYIWADFIWVLDADVFLTNPDTLIELISKNKTVVAPMLKSDGMYSNFWAGMTENYYYLRTDKYKPILFREETGCFNVPMIHSAVLIDLRRISSDLLSYKEENLVDYDDIPLYVCNDHSYGFVMVPLENQEGFAEDINRLTNIKTEILADSDYFPLSQKLRQFVSYPKQDKLGLDHIFMINLKRRPERRNRMQTLFKELGMEVEIIDAVDGRNLDDVALKSWGIEFMPNYADPYHNRPMTMGETGCMLSHYLIWEKVMQNNYQNIMVLEDDVHFEPFFRQKINFILAELKQLRINWDLVYLGRKKMSKEPETQIAGSQYLLHAGYSYWTIGYLLSASGAEKLLQAKPLKNLVPVDEYLPILSDTHPRNDWKSHFPKRDFKILSSNPLVIYPMHYTGEKGYTSDTEDSVLALNVEKPDKPRRREDL